METPERNYNISITSGTIVKAFLIIALLYTLFLIKDVVLVIIAAVVVASSVEPMILWWRKFGLKRVPSAIISYIIIVLGLSFVLVFFIPKVLGEASSYLSQLPDNINVSDLWSPVNKIGIINDGEIIKNISPQISIQNLTNEIKEIVSGTSEGVIKTAGLVFGGALSFILIIVLSFYLAVQEDGVGNFLRVISPTKIRSYVIDVWQRSQKKIGFWMQGQLLLGLLVGVLVYMGLLVLGIKHALLLATLAAIFEIIPVFGPILSAVPAILVAMVDGGASGALLVLILYILIHQFENHLLYPLVVKKIVGISPIVVILALVVGGKLAGILGLLLSVPIASVLMEFYSDFEKRRKIARELID